MIQKMCSFYEGSVHDIDHFLKVYAYAKVIAGLEGLDKYERKTVIYAAIVHDIACPLCRKKYGSAAGHYQEIESEALLRPFLDDFGLKRDMLERIIYLVSHHHSPKLIDNIDFQILIEADYLVNAGEMGIEKEKIRAFRDAYFRTAAGTALLNDIYLRK